MGTKIYICGTCPVLDACRDLGDEVEKDKERFTLADEVWAGESPAVRWHRREKQKAADECPVCSIRLTRQTDVLIGGKRLCRACYASTLPLYEGREPRLCRNGHLLEGENRNMRNGYPYCRACHRKQSADYLRKKRAAA